MEIILVTTQLTHVLEKEKGGEEGNDKPTMDVLALIFDQL
jgi:hypothetical protein